MAQTKHQIRELLNQIHGQPKKRFGQNFMIDGNLVRLVAEAGQISAGDCVIEVGPGTGTLTEELLQTGADVVALEIDRDLAELLRNRFGDRPNFRLIEGDALAGKHALNPELLATISGAKELKRTVRLVANLPYNIASPLLIEALIAGVDVLAFTVQKEVGDRLRAAAGSEDYGPISIMAQLLAKVELLRTLPPQVFWPSPKVESALLRLVRSDQLGERASEFGMFVSRLFSNRRKMLRTGLENAGIDSAKALAATGLSGQLRPENLTPQQILRLHDSKLIC